MDVVMLKDACYILCLIYSGMCCNEKLRKLAKTFMMHTAFRSIICIQLTFLLYALSNFSFVQFTRWQTIEWKTHVRVYGCLCVCMYVHVFILTYCRSLNEDLNCPICRSIMVLVFCTLSMYLIVCIEQLWGGFGQQDRLITGLFCKRAL